MEKEKLLILDGNSLMFRAYYALPPLTNSEGIHTNAIYGFLNMLLKMKEEINPNYIVATFDKKAPTFRHKEYKEYKAGRKKTPPELLEQMPIAKKILKNLSISIFEIEGFEADDLIGTLSCFAEERGIEVYIVTGDRDALQLATDNIKVIINKKGMTEKEIYDRKRMKEEYGVTPTEFIDVKGLMGDKSDNIPGVPGIGEKTAYKLIKEYKSIENVLMNIDNIKGKKIKENLKQYSEQAIFSKKLATIIKNVPIEINWEEIKYKGDYDAEVLRKMFSELEFKSLMNKIPKSKEELKRENVDISFMEIKSLDELKRMKDFIKETMYILYEAKDESIYSKCSVNKLYINCNDKNYVVYIEELFKEDKEETLKILKLILEDENIEKISHSFKILYTVFNKLGINIKGVKFDTELAAYLMEANKGKYDLKDIIQKYLMIDINEENEEGKIKQIIFLKDLYNILKGKVEEFNMNELLYELEQPLTKVLACMESNGFNIDKEKLEELRQKFSKEIDLLQKEIHELADEEFNINSPKQLGKILFEKLDLPVIKKTKTGYSTNAEVLEKLKDKHIIIPKIMLYRQITKLYSTYVEGLKAVIDVDNRIHSSFNQTITSTGRLSSTEPNLQNIPIKYEMGREIRKIFIAENEECVILSADYSQIELRVLAHMAEDFNMIEGFKHHKDIHSKTASEVFDIPIDEVTPLMRSRAKAVNFGIVYGISDFSLAKDLNIPKSEAKQYIETYFNRYPKIKEYLDDVIKKAKQDGYVETIFHRRRAIPEINASNKIVKALGERLAMNTPIQGSAADIIKIAMINVYNKLKNEKYKSTLILQVHDELILNVYKDELEDIKLMVKKEMENVMELSVPLEVDINIGSTWYDAK